MFRCHERSAGQVYFYPYNQNKIEIQGNVQAISKQHKLCKVRASRGKKNQGQKPYSNAHARLGNDW